MKRKEYKLKYNHHHQQQQIMMNYNAYVGCRDVERLEQDSTTTQPVFITDIADSVWMLFSPLTIMISNKNHRTIYLQAPLIVRTVLAANS
jgi:hypothetical protein